MNKISYLDIFHLLSPITYYGFVIIIKKYITPCPESTIMKKIRKIHNIFLSILSAIMLILLTIGTYQESKFSSIYSLYCDSFNNNEIVILSTSLFLYSKYIEWGDTLFLQLSGKKISMLQLTHHASTGILSYLNYRPTISPCSFIPQGLNCFVHIPMYWYFAYPKGFLFKFRKSITKIQIYQHIIIVFSCIYTIFINPECKQNYYGIRLGLALYLMYFVFFMEFYIRNYIKKLNTN